MRRQHYFVVCYDVDSKTWETDPMVQDARFDASVWDDKKEEWISRMDNEDLYNQDEKIFNELQNILALHNTIYGRVNN